MKEPIIKIKDVHIDISKGIHEDNIMQIGIFYCTNKTIKELKEIGLTPTIIKGKEWCMTLLAEVTIFNGENIP